MILKRFLKFCDFEAHDCYKKNSYSKKLCNPNTSLAQLNAFDFHHPAKKKEMKKRKEWQRKSGWLY